ncbi:MAG: zinc-dependent alcohol dehydrogenase [Pigmentiphaga sp.]|uniref:zinc-dependent alcohol dehydrogenase n=1 Tax=Pigmentiphaga sp. TaxID=1977564 RepID=UPI0029B68437|nr:zinc-dependent alcohol dehydrogenase [Pigmentiphaga sp.]MDX3906083.1 zinc-dependent alcohol dehydrogenase [Pigmentiphaga sp.]
MKAVVFHGIGDIRLDDVADPAIEQETDAIVRLTASAICGTDLHFIRGTMEGVKPGTVLGHEGVGVVEQLGREVRNLKAGDRVIIPSTIACGYCSYCRAGYYAQCDNANPHGKQAGTAFYGGPEQTGPFSGLQAEKARIPFASVNLVKIPDDVSDDQAIMLSDIFPTGYFGADLAGIKPGHTVAVFGCGPVGQFAIASAKLMKAGRIFAVDAVPDRLEMARAQGAEVVDFNTEDPVQAIRQATGGIGVDCAIDAVGVDAVHAHTGPASHDPGVPKQEQQAAATAPHAQPSDGNWVPGDAPGQALDWAVRALAKAGTLSIIGVYPPTDNTFPIGVAMNKNLTIRMGNCNHRKYIPELVELVRTGVIDPLAVLTKREPLASAIDAYKAFDRRKPGWVKVELEVSA